MAEFVSGTGITLGFDITDTGVYVEANSVITNFEEAINEVMDTFHTLDSNISKTVKTAVDPEWSFTFKGDIDNEVIQFIVDKKYATGSDAVVPFELGDVLSTDTVTGNMTIGGISITYETPTVIEGSFILKPYDGVVAVA